MLRHRPTELLFSLAKEKGVGIICRVPLASGLLTGKFSSESVFGRADHRFFNRKGEAFDKGETFSGVDYDLGLRAVNELKDVFGEGQLTMNALRWILMQDAVGCVITGASTPAQIKENVKASQKTALTQEQMDAVRSVYEKYIRNPVHYLW